MTVQEVFAERLLTLRESRGLTRQQLAEKLGVTRASLEYYEKGKRKPDIEMLVKISKCFPASTDYLLGLTKDPTADKDTQAVCEYTGLSSEAIEIIRDDLFGKNVIEVINTFLKGFLSDENYKKTLSLTNFCDSLIRYRETLSNSNDYFSEIFDQSISLYELSVADRDTLFSNVQRCKDSVSAAEYQVIQSAVKLSRLFSNDLYEDNKELQEQFEREKLTYMLDTDRSDDNGCNQETQ